MPKNTSNQISPGSGNISTGQPLPSPISLLIIDDSETDRATYIRFLQSGTDHTYTIIEAETVENGLELWRSQNPDIVLLDINLPDGDGLEFLEAIIGESPSEGKLPVIVLTGHGDERTAVKAMKLGAADYLVKGDLTAVSLSISVSNVHERTTITRTLARSQQQDAMKAEIALRIRQYLNLEEILKKCVEELRGFLAADRVLIYQFHPDMSGTIVAEALVPPWQSSLNVQVIDTCFQENRGIRYLNGRAFAASDIYTANLTECHIQLLERFQVRANLVVPILRASQETQPLWGLLIAHQCSGPRDWEETDIDFLGQLSVQLAIAIQQAELYQNLQTLNASLEQKVEERTRELKLSENRFRAIFDNMFQWIGLLSPDGILLEVNQIALDVAGLKREDVLNRPFWETYWWQTSPATQQRLRHAIVCAAQGEFIREEMEVLGLGGEKLVIDFSLRPLRDESGEVIMLIPEGRDITETKRTQAILQLHTQILDQIHSAVVSTDIKGTVQTWNRGAEELYGYTEAEMVGHNISLVYEDSTVLQTEIIDPLLAKGAHEAEVTTRSKSGSLIYVTLRLSLMRDEQGEITRLIGCSNDITEYKKAQQQLQQLNQNLESQVEKRTQELWQVNSLQRAILDSADYAIFSTNLTGIIQTCNPRAERMLGYSAAEMIGKFTPLIFCDRQEIMERAASLSIELGQDIPPGIEVFLTKTRQGILREEEWTTIRKDGSRFPCLLSISALKDVNQQIIGFVGIGKDITQRKVLEERLVYSEKKMRAIFESITDIILTINLEGNKFGNIEIPPVSHSLINTRYSEIIKITINNFLLDSLNNDWLQKVQEVVRSGKPTQFDYSLPIGGDMLWFSAALSPINATTVTWVARDITDDRKRAEAELQKLSDRLALALKSGAIGCWEWDIVKNILIWDERMYELYGVTKPSEPHLVYDFWANGLHPDDRIPTEKLLQQAILGQAEYDTEFRVLHPDGSIHFIKASGVVVRDNLGIPQSMIGINLDISQRKETEAKLAESEAKFRRLVEGANNVIWSCDDEFRINYLSPQFQTIFGWDEREWIGKKFIKLVHPDALFLIANDYQENIKMGKKSTNLEFQYRHKNGSYIWVRTSNTAVKNAEGEIIGIQGILSDISDIKEIEIALKSSENRFRKVFTSNVVGMMFTDFSGQILDANDRFLEIIGYSREDLNANRINWEKLTPPEYAFQDIEVMEHLKKSGAITPWEKEYYHKDGSRVPVLIGVALLTETDSSCVCVVVDIRARKEAEVKLQQQAKEERLLASIIQRMRSSLNLDEILNATVKELHQVLESDRVLVYRIFADGTGTVIAESVSPNWPPVLNMIFPEEIFPPENYDRDVQGKVYTLGDREDEKESILPCLVEFLRKIQVKAKIVVPIIQNETLWGLLISHQCDRERQWEEWEIELLQNTADQLAIAIQQSSLFEQLNRELAQRELTETKLTETNTKLIISNQELARATRLKDEFLANMSHELRTPLNAILGMTEGLQEEVFGTITQEQIKALQTIESSGSHLLELINDILDIAKIESGTMDLDCTPVSIAYLCQSSLAFIKQQALKKRIQLEIKLPLNLPELLIDERRIRQALINLLNNAVKFTPVGGRITLEVSRQQSPVDSDAGDSPLPNTLRIAVIDTGIGIAPEDINKLFQPFMQIDSALNRQYQGTGLGLALVKRIVELHRGQVGLTSEVGVGSCFTIKLPCGDFAPSSPEAETPSWGEIEPSQPETRASPLILLAEDNEANIMTVSSYLKAKGYRILLAQNGQDAIDFAKKHSPDLILMDIQMPGMDGLEAIKQIRLDPNLVDVPIIALTALAMTGDRDRCLAQGANDYLTKPVKLKQLATTIQRLLEPV
jgi:PAS domain S-box-containing protein